MFGGVQIEITGMSIYNSNINIFISFFQELWFINGLTKYGVQQGTFTKTGIILFNHYYNMRISLLSKDIKDIIFGNIFVKLSL